METGPSFRSSQPTEETARVLGVELGLPSSDTFRLTDQLHTVSCTVSVLQSQLVEDFRTLRKTAEDMNLFKASPLFFSLYLGHIIAMEVLAWLMISYFGTGWITTLIAACILTTSQVRSSKPRAYWPHRSLRRRPVCTQLLLLD